MGRRWTSPSEVLVWLTHASAWAIVFGKIFTARSILGGAPAYLSALDLASLAVLAAALSLGTYLRVVRARRAALLSLTLLSLLVIGAQVYAAPVEARPSPLAVRVETPGGTETLVGRTTLREWRSLEVVWPVRRMTQIRYDFEKGENPRCGFPEYRAYAGPEESVEFVLGRVAREELSGGEVAFCAWVIEEAARGNERRYLVGGVVTEQPDGSTRFDVRYWEADPGREFSGAVVLGASLLSVPVGAAVGALRLRPGGGKGERGSGQRGSVPNI